MERGLDTSLICTILSSYGANHPVLQITLLPACYKWYNKTMMGAPISNLAGEVNFQSIDKSTTVASGGSQVLFFEVL